MDTIGFIGAGNMAEALIRGVILAHVYRPERIYISDVRPERLEQLAARYGVRPIDENARTAELADVLVLSVKPQNLADALESIRGHVRSDTLVISIVAGKRIETIARYLGDVAIARVMPNMPALVDEGASALYANTKALPKMEKARLIFLCVGKAVVVDSEDMIDVVTAISGSGPAYYFLLMDQMIKAGVDMGLPLDLSTALVLQTAKGAALMAELADREGQRPSDLAAKVATKGGTTEAAFKTFREGRLYEVLQHGIRQAYLRSRELSNE
ncbi:MAG: pyrroline-5-carboxylate reductase [Sedimentisphaerales bacterium]|nr:pyrroline-5-carboxylate reductase [Sedimentisphaerales bacterium]